MNNLLHKRRYVRFGKFKEYVKPHYNVINNWYIFQTRVSAWYRAIWSVCELKLLFSGLQLWQKWRNSSRLNFNMLIIAKIHKKPRTHWVWFNITKVAWCCSIAWTVYSTGHKILQCIQYMYVPNFSPNNQSFGNLQNRTKLFPHATVYNDKIYFVPC